ncbi:hypothetical protein [Geobacter anodireducens]|nr:hypothetical protein [Geobacter soli]
MAMDTEEELAWIRNNLDIEHRQLSREQATRWLELLLADRKNFYVLGLMGFILKRRRDAQQVQFSNEELSSFCGEFMLKIRLAARRRRTAVSLPLFDLVGRRTLRSYDLID